MPLKIVGQVHAKWVVGAAIAAHVTKGGSLTERQNAGVNILKQYLGENRIREEEYKKNTGLPLEALFARACLSKAMFKEASSIIANITGPEELNALFGKIVSPFYMNVPTLFGSPIGPTKISQQEALKISGNSKLMADLFGPYILEKELVMIEIPNGGGKSISLNQFTNEQYGTFIEQTGHELPRNWNVKSEKANEQKDITSDSEDSIIPKRLLYKREEIKQGGLDPKKPVDMIIYNNDIVSLANWLGMRVPTVEELLKAKPFLNNKKEFEWTATIDENGKNKIISLYDYPRNEYEADPNDQAVNNVGFRLVDERLESSK